MITPAQGPAFVEAIKVNRFHGVGPKTAEKMNRLGIYTGADLRRQSLAFLQQEFGSSGARYYAISRGHDDRPVIADRPRKSSGSETTFATDLLDPGEIEAGVCSMADEVWAWCEKTGAYGRTVTVKLKYADFQRATRSRTLTAPVMDQFALRRVGIDLVRSVFPPEQGIRLLGVTLSHFDSDTQEHEQLALGL